MTITSDQSALENQLELFKRRQKKQRMSVFYETSKLQSIEELHISYKGMSVISLRYM